MPGRPGQRVRAKHRYPDPLHPGRSTSGAMHSQEIEEFLRGEWISTPVSTMTSQARWVDLGDYSVGSLEVEFANSGVRWSYPCSEADAEKFAEAPSKGGWIHDHFISAGITGSQI